MMAQDPNYNSKPIEYDSNGGYYILNTKYDKNLSIKVYCGNDVVAQYENENLISTGSYSYGIVSNTFVAYLPACKEYTVVTNNSKVEVFRFDQTKRDLEEVDIEYKDNKYMF